MFFSLTALLQKGHNDASQMHPMVRFMRKLVSGFNTEKYWKRRAIVVDPNLRTPAVIKMYHLLYCKKIEMRQNASMGTIFNGGAKFSSVPHLPHGMNGIVIGHDVNIGSNVTIYHQVTISDGGGQKRLL